MQDNFDQRMREIDLDIQGLLFFFLHKWWIILLCIIAASLAALGLTHQFVTPTYRTNVSIYVNNNKSVESKDYLSGSDLSTAQRLVNTYVSIAKSNRVLEKISEQLNGEYSAEQLASCISAQQLNETEIFCIYVVHSDPEEAARIANAAADIAPQEIAALIEGTSAYVIDYAKVPNTIYSPNYVKKMSLGAVLGGVFAVILLTLYYISDTRIKDENDLTDLYPLPVLGRIPDFQIQHSESAYGYSDADSSKENTSK